MGGGIIIRHRAVVKTAVNDSSFYPTLSATCQAAVDVINAKGLADWTDGDYTYMVSMLIVGAYCGT
jgi:hypothetical protein